MISSIITKEMVQVKESVKDWREAIRVGAEPLLKHRMIKESYIDAMIKSVEDFGPYIILAPMIAMPHARPEAGSLEIGVSILKLKKPVSFTDDDQNLASLLLVLSCKESNKHIEVLSEISETLSDEKKYNKAVNAECIDDILEAFSII